MTGPNGSRTQSARFASTTSIWPDSTSGFSVGSDPAQVATRVAVSPRGVITTSPGAQPDASSRVLISAATSPVRLAAPCTERMAISRTARSSACASSAAVGTGAAALCAMASGAREARATAPSPAVVANRRRTGTHFITDRISLCSNSCRLARLMATTFAPQIREIGGLKPPIVAMTQCECPIFGKGLLKSAVAPDAQIRTGRRFTHTCEIIES